MRHLPACIALVVHLVLLPLCEAAAEPASSGHVGPPANPGPGLLVTSLGLVSSDKAPTACTAETIGAIASTSDGALCICKKSKDKKPPRWAAVASGQPCWASKK